MKCGSKLRKSGTPVMYLWIPRWESETGLLLFRVAEQIIPTVPSCSASTAPSCSPLPPPLARDDGWALPKLKAAGSGQPWPAASRRRSTRPPAPRPCPEKGKKKCMISKRLDRARSRTVNLLLAPLNPPLRREGGEESRRAAARRDLLHEPEADALSIRPHGRRIDATLPLPAELGWGGGPPRVQADVILGGSRTP